MCEVSSAQDGKNGKAPVVLKGPVTGSDPKGPRIVKKGTLITPSFESLELWNNYNAKGRRQTFPWQA